MKEDSSSFKQAIAILDWGIGGLGFYRHFKEKYPEASVCYFSDSGSTPYGKQNKADLLRRLEIIIRFLKNRQITNLVVACNAMSTVLTDRSMKSGFKDFNITGVILPAIQAAKNREGTKIGVVGGRRTILSRAYIKSLKENGRNVLQRIAQPVSAYVEKGETDSEAFRAVLKKIMLPLKQTDLLILACTHYEAVIDEFQMLAPCANIINPSYETLKWVERNWNIPKSFGPDIFYTTGNIREMKKASLIVFGIKICEIEKICI